MPSGDRVPSRRTGRRSPAAAGKLPLTAPALARNSATPRRNAASPRHDGYTYLLLLFTIAIMSTALAGATVSWRLEAQRAHERELLFIGQQFARAIESYYEEAPGGAKQYPASLTDLVTDRRGLTVKRHLRRIYIDPLTASREWGLVKEGERIVAVHSASQRRPLRRANFPAGFEHFGAAETYADWVFRGRAGAATPREPSAAPQ